MNKSVIALAVLSATSLTVNAADIENQYNPDFGAYLQYNDSGVWEGGVSMALSEQARLQLMMDDDGWAALEVSGTVDIDDTRHMWFAAEYGRFDAPQEFEHSSDSYFMATALFNQQLGEHFSFYLGGAWEQGKGSTVVYDDMSFGESTDYTDLQAKAGIAVDLTHGITMAYDYTHHNVTRDDVFAMQGIVDDRHRWNEHELGFYAQNVAGSNISPYIKAVHYNGNGGSPIETDTSVWLGVAVGF
ncbi:hypothetical protein [Agarivorans sp. 1_MG-2023]|uniref:hypothetical protein n=1 Tax=Agarivorans sp. 1_MG-2023 TaxID=3062634 RepID=UPI0026E26047|nr:hypothetical protein [Agarivorans sp. 1_MG-2023]MDO6765969.1 hypothetical protein [Agarivorans sp. 1_MG-2023]